MTDAERHAMIDSLESLRCCIEDGETEAALDWVNAAIKQLRKELREGRNEAN